MTAPSAPRPGSYQFVCEVPFDRTYRVTILVLCFGKLWMNVNVVGRIHLLVRSSITQAWQIWAAFKGIWICLLVLLLLVFGSEIASGMTKVCASSSLNFTTTDPGISASFRVTRPSLSSPAYLDNMYFDIKASCLPSCIWSGTVIDTAKLPMRFSFITYFLNRVSESGGKLEWKQTVATSLGIGYSARNSRRLS